MLFLLSDDLRTNAAAVLKRVSGFLGIEPFQSTAAKREHSREDYAARPSVTADDLEFFAKHVQHDLRDFQQLTGLSLDHWPTWRFLLGKRAA